MKIVCDREQLLSAFQTAALFAPGRSPKEILTNIKLDVDKDGATFSATDMEVGVRLKIEADGKTLYDELIKREPQLATLDVDLAGARRLRITVDYGGESFIGDQLVLCEAMFTK